MRKLVIESSKQLQGTVTIQGAKNAAQKMLPATVAFPGTYLIQHLPRIEDTRALLDILRFLGAEVTFPERHTVCINTERLVPQEIPPEMAATSTGTFLFAGALLSRFGHARVWHPGGDQIGKRRVTWHLEAFRRLGAAVQEEEAFYEVHASYLQGGTISFRRPTANGAINAVLTAMRARGTTTIENVAHEPEIQNAIQFFQTMGGQIHWSGPNTLKVEGITDGTGSGTIQVIPDRNDTVTFLIAGVLGHGPVTLQDVHADQVLPLLELLEQMGVMVETSTNASGQTITVQCGCLRAGAYQVTSRPFPGFSSDWGAIFQVALTQTPGTHVFHETVFARRFAHVPELVRMGAQIEPLALPVDEQIYNFDPDLIAPPAHAIQIAGPSRLHGASVHANDVRAGAALVLAGLVADGLTMVTGVEQIERGYEAFAERLRRLGAKVVLEEDAED
ncbi:MAG TPA: UDP-N-acetylglucosamine 1-carboxyvinyltransferase [Ktedonobacteraceae bacterium]|nr:UDP-N-acetylglucosamine 1-carboxyvinyltransferase [Ktedonobacteraceae bacterium]